MERSFKSLVAFRVGDDEDGSGSGVFAEWIDRCAGPENVGNNLRLTRVGATVELSWPDVPPRNATIVALGDGPLRLDA